MDIKAIVCVCFFYKFIKKSLLYLFLNVFCIFFHFLSGTSFNYIFYNWMLGSIFRRSHGFKLQNFIEAFFTMLLKKLFMFYFLKYKFDHRIIGWNRVFKLIFSLLFLFIELLYVLDCIFLEFMEARYKLSFTSFEIFFFFVVLY